MKYVFAMLLCCTLFVSLSAADDRGYSVDIPINTPGSGRYERFRPNHHVPFGVHWTEAKPADFVWLLPSMLGGTVGVAVGNVIGWPCKAVYNACRGEFSGEAMVPPLDWAGKYFGVPGSYIVGGPFWVLKKSFYDFPVWLFSSDEEIEKEEYDY